jgi:hypothetical protein
MARRPVRLLLLIALLGIGGAAAAFSAYQTRHVDELGRSALATTRRVDELLLTLQKVRDAQQAYVVINGNYPEAAEVSAHLATLGDEIAEIETIAHARQSIQILTSVRNDARALADIESKAQDHMRLGQDLMAADVISTEAGQTLARMSSALRDVRSTELSAIEVARSATLQKIWIVIGGAASFWLLGVFLLVGVPSHPQTHQAAPSPPAILAIGETTAPAPRPLVPAAHTAHSADLSEAADVCAAIARITDARDLQPLLTRAASALGASGAVVWMAAGEELIAASACGYESRALHRLGRIHRSALNATAVAWRSGTLQIVGSEASSQGAMVAPMLGTDRCLGVLAVEVPPGRETDETTQAIARFVAAQLAATLAPWPAASIAESEIGAFNHAAEA